MHFATLNRQARQLAAVWGEVSLPREIVDLVGRKLPTLLLLLALLLALSPVVAKGRDGLESNLRARMTLGEFGEPECAPISNLRPADRGLDGIRFDAIPGAHRIVVVPSSSGWRMTFGIPELLVFTAAGFYTMAETKFTGSDGIERPAREFRLTPKGFEAMVRPGADCFDYVSYRSLDVVSVEKIAVPERLSGLDEAYRVKFKLHHSEPAVWARTTEFNYVFNRVLTVGRDAAAPALREQILFRTNGRWMGERETMMALMLDAAKLKRPETVPHMQQQLAKMEAETAERRAEQASAVTASMLRAKLAEEAYSSKVSPCLDLPLHQADLTSGFWKKDGPPSLTFFDHPDRRDTSRYDHAIEFARRLEKVGMATVETFDGEPFPGARKGKGVRYTLTSSAMSALDPQRSGCLRLGDGKLERLRVVGTKSQGTEFRGWARLTQPLPGTAKLASVFPNVRSVLAQGYGFAGTLPLAETQPIQVQIYAPAFALTNPTTPLHLEPPVVWTGPEVIEHASDNTVKMLSSACAISTDGTEVSATHIPCTLARASRGFRAGKAYAEISFRGKEKGAYPDTWTNASVTSPRSTYSVSTGAALFSFAGSFEKQQVKDGDLIGIALDMDNRVLYWHRNGEWKTGRPGTGLGEPMVDTGDEYFVAVSVQNKTEGWRINFGSKAFRFPPPDGFPAYGAPRKSMQQR